MIYGPENSYERMELYNSAMQPVVVIGYRCYNNNRHVLYASPYTLPMVCR